MSDKRKMPVRTVDVDFAKDGYPDFQAKRRTNAAIGKVRRYMELVFQTRPDTEITDDMEREVREIMLDLFPEWQFFDDNGRPIPHTIEGFDELPTELVLLMHMRGVEAIRNKVMPAPLGSSSLTEPGDREQDAQPKKT